jgi:glycosyltransferase involved in cell wall biosynthesis
MRILIAANVPKRREGGVAGIVYGVGRGLEQRGHHVEYLFAGDLPTSSYVPSRFQELEFAIQLARLIHRDPTRYSVVNIHAPAGFAYGLLRYLSPKLRKYGPAYVMTLHGLEERRVHSMKREARKGKAFHFSFKNRLWHRIYHVPRYYFSIKTADHALCPCREVWTLAQLKYDLDPDQVTYSPSGVEERFFIQREYSTAASTRLLSAGTWLDDQRGIFYIRDALRNLAARLPGLRLTIAGCGSHGETIMNFFDPELRPMIDIMPVVPSDQMPSLFAQYDIFVWPSLMEGISLVVQEAMASGMAVITTESCGMIDSVENDFNGVLIPPADSIALEDAIWRLSQNPELRARLGKAAQETIRRRFTWARTIDSAEHACASALRRVGRESEIRPEPSAMTPKATVAEHS